MQLAVALMPLVLLQVCLFQSAYSWYTISHEVFYEISDDPGTSV